MDDMITVRPTALRDCADGLAGTGYRLGHGLSGVPGLVPPAPELAATGALAALETAVEDFLNTVATRTARTAAGLRTAAADYEAVDDQVARRFTTIR